MTISSRLTLISIALLQLGTSFAEAQNPSASLIAPAQEISHSLPQLETALQHALAHSPDMLEREIELAQKDASRYRGISTYLPRVELSYQAGGYHEIRKNLDADEQNRAGGNYTLEASHPLYHWGAYEAKRDLALEEESIAAINYTLGFAKLCPELRKDYLGLIHKKATSELYELQANVAAEKLETTKQLAKSGRETQQDVDRQTLEAETLKLKHELHKSELANELINFRNRSGFFELVASEIPSTIQFPEFDLESMQTHIDQYFTTSFDHSIISKLARRHLKAIDNRTTMARSRQLPTLNMGAGVSQGPVEDDGDYELQTIFFVGIQGTWTLFDRSETRDNLRSLNAARRLVKGKLQMERDRMRANANHALAQMAIALQAVESKESQTESVEKAKKLAQSLYEQGRIETAELNEALINTKTFELSILESQIDTLNAYYSFLATLLLDPAIPILTTSEE